MADKQDGGLSARVHSELFKDPGKVGFPPVGGQPESGDVGVIRLQGSDLLGLAVIAVAGRPADSLLNPGLPAVDAVPNHLGVLWAFSSPQRLLPAGRFSRKVPERHSLSVVASTSRQPASSKAFRTRPNCVSRMPASTSDPPGATRASRRSRSAMSRS